MPARRICDIDGKPCARNCAAYTHCIVWRELKAKGVKWEDAFTREVKPEPPKKEWERRFQLLVEKNPPEPYHSTAYSSQSTLREADLEIDRGGQYQTLPARVDGHSQSSRWRIVHTKPYQP